MCYIINVQHLSGSHIRARIKRNWCARIEKLSSLEKQRRNESGRLIVYRAFWVSVNTIKFYNISLWKVIRTWNSFVLWRFGFRLNVCTFVIKYYD